MTSDLSGTLASQSKMGFADLMVRQIGGEVTPVTIRPVLLGTLCAHGGGYASRVPLSRSEQTTSESLSAVQYSGGTEKNSHFISRMLEPAIAAAKKSGIPHQLIIAQAALESGWGNKEITTTNGKPSHNIFGIKATPDWKGESTEITTTEFVNGTAQKVKAAFRVYPHIRSVGRLTSRLNNNPVYQNVARSRSPEMAARHFSQADMPPILRMRKN